MFRSQIEHAHLYTHLYFIYLSYVMSQTIEDTSLHFQLPQSMAGWSSALSILEYQSVYIHIHFIFICNLVQFLYNRTSLSVIIQFLADSAYHILSFQLPLPLLCLSMSRIFHYAYSKIYRMSFVYLLKFFIFLADEVYLSIKF